METADGDDGFSVSVEAGTNFFLFSFQVIEFFLMGSPRDNVVLHQVPPDPARRCKAVLEKEVIFVCRKRMLTSDLLVLCEGKEIKCLEQSQGQHPFPV